MLKLIIADYINANMKKRGWTYRDTSLKAGVAESSIYSYAQGRVMNPNEDNLIRIAAAFGDPPEIIQQMRRESLDSTVEENKLIAESNDKERMESLAALLRKSMLVVMEEHRAASAAQQTEIIEHADRRVADERQRAADLNAKVLKQCNEEIERNNRHNAELLALKDEMITTIQQEREKVRAYLKRIIHNLTVALIAVSLFTALGLAALGGYAVYAYNTFDREDPTRGLYRQTPEPEETPYVGLAEINEIP